MDGIASGFKKTQSQLSAGLVHTHEFIDYFDIGAAPCSLGFSGNVVAGLAVTVPFICNTTLAVFALELIVTVLLIPPTLFVLYVTLITSLFPGRIGS
jgi:hypothetical protein